MDDGESILSSISSRGGGAAYGNSVSKTWCYTFNNPTDGDIARLKEYEVSVHVAGMERGDSGTPHLQGFITWRRAYRLAALKKLEPRAHWEPARTCDAANYCRKDGSDIVINITTKHQGKSSDFRSAVQKVVEGSSVKSIAASYPHVFVHRYKGLQALAGALEKNRMREAAPVVKWYWGPTGTGKTWKAMEEIGERDYWESSSSLQWFDGYDGQECVLLDELRADACKYEFLLKLLDRRIIQVPVKGGFVWWKPKEIWITSPLSPRMMFPEQCNDQLDTINQLLRRITEIKHMSTTFNPPSTGGTLEVEELSLNFNDWLQ